MSSIEKIVRPFQTGDVFRARRLPPSQLLVTAPELVSVDWEGRADSSYAEEDPNLQINFKVEWEEDRSKRQSKLMKVVNPDDPDQKVFMERVDSYTFVDKLTRKEQSFKFDWSQSLDNATTA
jgi:hypothetical protein